MERPLDRFHIGDAIRKERERRNWTRAYLAARSGIRANTIGDIEKSGNVSQPSLDRISKAFNFTIGDLHKLLEDTVGRSYGLIRPVQPRSECCSDSSHPHLHNMLEEILHTEAEEWACGIKVNIRATWMAATGKQLPSGNAAMENKQSRRPAESPNEVRVRRKP